MVDAKQTGATIAFLRKRAGMTQRELAERLGVTDKAVSRWERGIGVPDQSLLAKLADVLDTDIEAILAGEMARDSDWRGLLLLRYDEGLGPETPIYGKRSVYLQIGYFLLAGVRNIYIAGERRELDAARRALAESGLPEGAIELEFREASNEGEMATPASSSDHPTMLIFGLDLLYGKDLTRAFKRQMATCTEPVQLVGHGGRPTHVLFIPAGEDPLAVVSGDSDSAPAVPRPLERGIISFPIETPADALDAANLLAILERQCGKHVMDLREIARARGL